MGIYYEPDKGRCGDFVPFYWNKTWHLYCIKGEPWYHISTEDFVHFEELGIVIPSGGQENQDLSMGTGSVIEKDGFFHFFYTGFNRH